MSSADIIAADSLLSRDQQFVRFSEAPFAQNPATSKPDMAASRKHKPRHGAKSKPNGIFGPIGLIGSLLLCAAIVFTNLSDDSHPKSNALDGLSRRREERKIKTCISSCDDLVISGEFQSELGRPSSEKSLALASSAADALFSIRTTNDTKGEGNRSDAIPDNTHRHRRDRVGQVSIGAVDRPPRLPPLIKVLVGTVDESYHLSPTVDANDRGQTNRRSTKVREDTKSSKNRPKDGPKAGGDSVAMAAAAAAAAVWSQSIKGRGHFRMKAQNEEWESSLRWIAGWSQRHDHTFSIESTTADNKKETTRRKRKRRSDHDRKNLESALVEENRSSKGWVLCMKECLGESAADYWAGQHNNPFANEKNGIIVNERGFIKITGDIVLSIASSWLFRGKSGLNSFGIDSLSMGLLQIFASSLLIFCGRFLWQWGFSISSSDTTPKWVLDEERKYAQHRSQGQKDRNSTKKKTPSGKKARRKRNHDRSQTTNAPQVSTAILKEAQSLDGLEMTEDISLSTTAEEHRIFEYNEEHTSQGYSSKHTDFWSKRPDAVVKIGERLVHQLPQEVSTHLSVSPLLLPKAYGTNHDPLTASSGYSPLTMSPAGSETRRYTHDYESPSNPESTSNHGIQKSKPVVWRKSMSRTDQSEQNRHSHPHKSRRVKNKKVESGKRSSFQTSHTPLAGLYSKNYPVPTDAQREEASRQLRVYQAAQIQKLSQRNTKIESMTPNATRRSFAEAAAYSILHQGNSENAVYNNSVRVVASHDSYYYPAVAGDLGKSQDLVEDNMSNTRLLLSNMLEDDDDFRHIVPTLPPITATSRLDSSLFASPGHSSTAHSNVQIEHSPLLQPTRTWGELPLRLSVANSGSTTDDLLSNDLLNTLRVGTSSTCSPGHGGTSSWDTDGSERIRAVEGDRLW